MKHILSGVVALLSLAACMDPFQIPEHTVSSGLKPVLSSNWLPQGDGLVRYTVGFKTAEDDCLRLTGDARVTVNGTIQATRSPGSSTDTGCRGESWDFRVPQAESAFTVELVDATGTASIRVANVGTERDYDVEGLEPQGGTGFQYGVRPNTTLTVHWPVAEDFALTGGAFNMELHLSDGRANDRVKSFPAAQVDAVAQTLVFNVPELPTDASSASLEVSLDASRIILACTGFTACDGESVPFASSTFQQVALLPAR